MPSPLHLKISEGSNMAWMSSSLYILALRRTGSFSKEVACMVQEAKAEGTRTFQLRHQVYMQDVSRGICLTSR